MDLGRFIFCRIDSQKAIIGSLELEKTSKIIQSHVFINFSFFLRLVIKDGTKDIQLCTHSRSFCMMEDD